MTWEKNRDGIWYSDSFGKMDLEYQANSSPTAITIGRIEEMRRKLTAVRIHQLLWATKQEFPECQVRCILHREVAPLFRELAEKGAINYDTLKHPYSTEAKLLDIQPL